MNCIICHQDTNYKSNLYVQVVCKTCEETLTTSKQVREDFYEEYDKLHAACPNCGDIRHTTTFVAYVLDMDNITSYKDLNRCVCMACGDNHTVHDRVPILK